MEWYSVVGYGVLPLAQQDRMPYHTITRQIQKVRELVEQESATLAHVVQQEKVAHATVTELLRQYKCVMSSLASLRQEAQVVSMASYLHLVGQRDQLSVAIGGRKKELEDLRRQIQSARVHIGAYESALTKLNSELQKYGKVVQWHNDNDDTTESH